MRWDGPSEASGARAARVLPCCFALLEAAIEALAADTQAAEAAAGGGGGGAPPALSDAVATRALFSLQEAVETVLQFVEQTAGEEEEAAAQQGSASSGVRHALLLAAVRVLGRFCAEVPEAFGGRLRPLLPTLLALRADGGAEEQQRGQPSPAGALPVLQR